MRLALILGLLVLVAGPQLLRAQPAASVEKSERFVGKARVGSEAPLPLHLEIRRSGSAASGVISTPGANFQLFELRGVDTMTGRLSGDGAEGKIELRFFGDAVEGSFDLAGQAGTLRAHRTTLDALTALKSPDQSLELTSKQWADDLDRLLAILTTEHAQPYTHVSRVHLMQQADRIRALIPTLSGVQVALHFRRLGAMIGDGHTSVDLPRKRPRYPLEMFWFEDGLRVIAAPADRRDLLGAKLLSVNEVATAELLNSLRAYRPARNGMGLSQRRSLLARSRRPA